MSNIYHGWIPILGTRLHFDYGIEELEKSVKGLSKGYVESCGIKYDPNHKYYSIYTDEDVENKRFESIVSVDKNNRIDNIYIPDRKGKKLKSRVVCEIDDKGLVTLELPEEDVSKEMDKTYVFYRIVRDIYHIHTHHEDSKDSLLKIAPTKDKLEGIEQILSHFEQKIIIAHKRLRDTMSRRSYEYARRLITQSEGEMIYALNFVNLFKEEIHLKTQNPNGDKEYNFVFSNALQSLNVLASKIENKYNYDLNKIITILTYGILLFTVPIMLDASFNVFGTEIGRIISSTLASILLFVIFMSSRNKFS